MNQPVGTAQQALDTGSQETRRPVFCNGSGTIKHFGDFSVRGSRLSSVPGLKHHPPARCALFGWIQGIWKLSGTIESVKPLQGERLLLQMYHTRNDKSQTHRSFEKGPFGNRYLKMTILVAQQQMLTIVLRNQKSR